MAEPPDFGTLVSIAGALGAFIAAFIGGLNRKSSKDSATGVAEIQTTLAGLTKQVTALASRFDQHEGAILVRVGSLEQDGKSLEHQLRALAQRVSEALARLDSMGTEKGTAHAALWQAMDEVRRDLRQLEIRAPRWGNDEA